MLGKKNNMGLSPIDDEYETKMVGFEVDCNDGKEGAVADACHHVGEFFSIVKNDHERSSKVYEKNCVSNGFPPSCFNLAKLHLAGVGVDMDDDKAFKYFDMACKGGHNKGCYYTALLQYYDLHHKQKRRDNVRKKSDHNTGSNDSQAAAIDVRALASRSSTEPSRKMPLIEKEDQKMASSSISKGSSSLPLHRATEKQKAALKILDKVCRDGEPDSCHFAASHYVKPGLDPRDRSATKAVEYWKVSCDRNHAPSCYNLAVTYRYGDEGVPKDAQMFEEYKQRTNKLLKMYGGLQGKRM